MLTLRSNFFFFWFRCENELSWFKIILKKYCEGCGVYSIGWLTDWRRALFSNIVRLDKNIVSGVGQFTLCCTFIFILYHLLNYIFMVIDLEPTMLIGKGNSATVLVSFLSNVR